MTVVDEQSWRVSLYCVSYWVTSSCNHLCNCGDCGIKYDHATNSYCFVPFWHTFHCVKHA